MGKYSKSKSPVAHRLHEARLRADISQKQLGIKAGIDEFSASARINQYERDKHVPDYSTAKRLAKALGVPVTYLFADDDQLADMILSMNSASTRKRAQALKLLK